MFHKSTLLLLALLAPLAPATAPENASPTVAAAAPDEAARLDEAEAAYERKDYAQVLEIVQPLAEAGNGRAQNYLGLLYDQGQAVKKDPNRAREWFQKAAEAGNAVAQYNLGLIYMGGPPAERDYIEARQWFEKAAKVDVAAAKTNLGVLYAQGLGVRQDYAQARRWYERAAADGDASAQNNLGSLYVQGQGVKQDYDKARRWFEQAGNAEAQNNLGVLYEQGWGVARDEAKARKLYEQAAAAGESNAQANLARLQRAEAQDTEDEAIAAYNRQDYAKARELWQPQAEAAGADNAIAQFNMGILYYAGQGVEKDPEKARYWWEKAAAAGHREARQSLALLEEQPPAPAATKMPNYSPEQLSALMQVISAIDSHQHAASVRKDLREMADQANAEVRGDEQIREISAQAAAGDAKAQYLLAMLHYSGRGVKQDYGEAYRLLEKASVTRSEDAGVALIHLRTDLGNQVVAARKRQDYAYARKILQILVEADDDRAQNNLAYLYQHGLGGEKDYVKARELYEKAIANGHMAARINLGQLYEQGQGVPPDYARARELYEQAAADGWNLAKFRLGRLYEQGLGVPQDYAKARKLYEESVDRSADSQNALGQLYERGLGVPQDYGKAREWYEMAVRSKVPLALVNLGHLYEQGLGVAKDEAKAQELYQRATELNDEEAQQALQRRRGQAK